MSYRSDEARDRAILAYLDGCQRASERAIRRATGIGVHETCRAVERLRQAGAIRHHGRYQWEIVRGTVGGAADDDTAGTPGHNRRV